MKKYFSSIFIVFGFLLMAGISKGYALDCTGLGPECAWLAAHPTISNAIVWEDSSVVPAVPLTYSAWPLWRKQALSVAYQTALNGGSYGLTDPPPNMLTLGDCDPAQTVLAEGDAWSLYISYVANSLTVEIGHRVSWSLLDYSAQNLKIFLDSREMFSWDALYQGYVMSNYVTPAPPDFTFSFLVENAIGAPDRLTTIVNLLDWSRNHVQHYYISYYTSSSPCAIPHVSDTIMMYWLWQYRGLPPVSETITGTLDHMSNQFSRWAWGCGGMTGFLRAVLRTVNIPVTDEVAGGHSYSHFTSEGLSWCGDDPYRLQISVPSTPPIPTAEVLFNQAKWDSWFGPGVPDAQKGQNVLREVAELEIKYLPDYLLTLYRDDFSKQLIHADGSVYSDYKGWYSLAELENTNGINLWGRMDAKWPPVPLTTASPLGGAYKAPQTVTLSCSDGTTGLGCDKIYFTTNGSTPTTTSSVYASPLSIAATTTLKYFATDLAGNSEAVKTQSYIIDTVAPTTTATPLGGTYTDSQTVTLTCDNGMGSSCNKIYYTTNGTTPWSASSVYSTPLSITASTTLKYFATDLAGNSEAVKTQSYIINHAPTLGTVTPSVITTAVGTPQTFTAIYSDADGYANLSYVYFLVNTTTSDANSISLMYERKTNTLYLYSDAGTAGFAGYCTPGVTGVTIINTQGTLDCAATTVSGSGNDLIINWSITPTVAFASTTAKNLYLYAYDMSLNGAGWSDKGNWTILDCDDRNVCTIDSFDAATGQCVNTPVANGTSCADNNVCNGMETCQGGICKAGTPLVCNDNNLCTIDTCDPVKGCVYTPKCDDNNICTTDTCNTRTGACTHTNNTLACNDNNACTTNDKCSGGVCKGTAKNCSDNNACTTDTCDPATGTCGHTPIVCNDNKSCTTDTCNPTSGCVYTAVANGTVCSEVSNGRCQTGNCVNIDLVPTAMTATKSGTTGVLVSETVKNQGSNSAGSFAITYYLSTNTAYESGTDIVLASSSNGTGTCSRTISSLSSGATSTVTNKNCYKPSGAVAGQKYYVLVRDDSGNAVSESDETNNVKSTLSTISW